MSDLPERIYRTTSLSPTQLGRAERLTRRAELEVYGHTVRAAVAAQKDEADSQALGDALQCAMDEEISLLDYGLSRANGSVAKTELVAQKIAMFSAINNKRIGRRFS